MVMDTIRLSEWEERTEDLFINFNYLEFIDTENFYMEQTKKKNTVMLGLSFLAWCLFLTNMV